MLTEPFFSANIILKYLRKYFEVIINRYFDLGGVTSSLPQSATTGYHAGSVLAMEDDIQGGAVSIDMGGAVQSFMQVCQMINHQCC